jgi:hypothetical protein
VGQIALTKLEQAPLKTVFPRLQQPELHCGWPGAGRKGCPWTHENAIHISSRVERTAMTSLIIVPEKQQRHIRGEVPQGTVASKSCVTDCAFSAK